jgi:intracellular sulfur oxidation DsrE/DsrF family protein
MFKNRTLMALSVTSLVICFGALSPAGNTDGKAEQTLRIDIPVKIEKANVAIDMGHLVFAGDSPFALGDLHLLANDFRDWNTKGKIVAVFHGDAAYVVVNDDTYNAVRHVTTGNPHRELMAELIKEGVQIELCGATAAANHWGNANLLPGVMVNTNAMVRLTQLEQQGYQMIYE